MTPSDEQQQATQNAERVAGQIEGQQQQAAAQPQQPAQPDVTVNVGDQAAKGMEAKQESK